MDLEHYKAASERTDADERLLIPGFKRMRPESPADADAAEALEQLNQADEGDQ